MIRVNGRLDPISGSVPLTKEIVEEMFYTLYPEAASNVVLQNAQELDFSHWSDIGIGLRVNAYRSLSRRAIALRRINTTAPSMHDIGLPTGANKLLTAKQGMFIASVILILVVLILFWRTVLALFLNHKLHLTIDIFLYKNLIENNAN